jgi:arylsulfatase A-like enzyme
LEAGHLRLLIALEALPLFVVTSSYPLAAPVVNVLFFCAAGLVFWAIRRWRPAACPTSAVLIVFALGLCTVVVWHVAKHWLPMHSLAQTLLAIGLGLQLGRFLAARQGGFEWVVRWTAPGLLVIVAVVAVLTNSTAAPAAGPTLAAATKTADAPNVLFIVMDTVRAKSLSLHGYERPTSPNLDRFAEQGLVFDHAVATAPWTLPSHASMFTGRNPDELSADWCKPLDGRPRTLAEELASRGYATAGFVANAYYCGKHTGLDRGFQYYSDTSLASPDALRNTALGRMLLQTSLVKRCYGLRLQWPGRKDAAQINRELIAWLGARRDDRPYFAFLNYFDVHDPYLAGDPGRDPACCAVSHWRPNYSDRELAELRESYELCIERLDSQIGRLLDELRRRGSLENTLVVVTSDHGEQFGENGLVGHCNSLFRPATHVPLIIVDPRRVPAGRRVAEVVSLRDLAATVLDAAGGAGDSTIPGRSLARFWDPALANSSEGAPVMSYISRGVDAPDWYPNATSDLQSVWRDDSYLVRRLEDGAEQIFELECDAP